MLPPDPKNSSLTRELTHAMCILYDSEEQRQKRFMQWFSDAYKYDIETRIGRSSAASEPASDGHVFARSGKFVIAVTECKLEVGSTKSEARYQSMAYWTKLFQASEEMKDHIGESCLPAILIANEGEGPCSRLLSRSPTSFRSSYGSLGNYCAS